MPEPDVDLSTDALAVVIALLALSLIDLHARLHLELPAKTRWFWLHIWLNLMVILTSLDDTLLTVRHPLRALYTPWSSGQPYAIAFAGHLYHCIAFFPHLRRDDWLHHAVMVFFALPLQYAYGRVAAAHYALFGLSGLWGGLDYVLLVGVYAGVVDGSREKRWNMWIHTWLRMPWLVMGAAWWYAGVAGGEHVALAGEVRAAGEVFTGGACIGGFDDNDVGAYSSSANAHSTLPTALTALCMLWNAIYYQSMTVSDNSVRLVEMSRQKERSTRGRVGVPLPLPETESTHSPSPLPCIVTVVDL